MRNVVIHYHLFKNAGSSVDALLKKSFGEKWMPFDPSNPAGKVSADNLSELIEATEDIVAYSSHCIVPPLPVGNFKVHPMVVLRDPIARVMSAYSFEWKKQLGLDKAKGTLSEYVQEKFSKPRANAIEEFQTFRLAVNDSNKTHPGRKLHDETVLAQSQIFISSLAAFGLVEEFATSLQLFERSMKPAFPEMQFEMQTSNVTQSTSIPMCDRHEKIRSTIGSDAFDELVRRNLLDIRLYAYAKGRFSELKKILDEGEELRGDTPIADIEVEQLASGSS